MHTPIRLGYLLTAASLLAALTGCSGGASAVNVPPGSGLAGSAVRLAGPDLLDTLVVTSGVYIALANQTNLYALPDPKNIAPKCTFPTANAKGIAVDAAGTLWVPSSAALNVTTYKKGTCKQAALTLNEPNGSPNAVAFSNTGTVYVADIVGTGGSNGVISVYPKGASSPSSTLSNPEMIEIRGVAVDKAGDVFASGVKEQGSIVVEFKNGKMPGKLLRLQTGIADGMEVDKNQNLLVVDPGARLVEAFPPPYSGPAAFTIPTKGSSEFGHLDAANKNIYVSNFSSGTVDVFKYPSGLYKYSISNGVVQDGVWGVAVMPAFTN
jgi:hypothetical protein